MPTTKIRQKNINNKLKILLRKGNFLDKNGNIKEEYVLGSSVDITYAAVLFNRYLEAEYRFKENNKGDIVKGKSLFALLGAIDSSKMHIFMNKFLDIKDIYSVELSGLAQDKVEKALSLLELYLKAKQNRGEKEICPELNRLINKFGLELGAGFCHSGLESESMVDSGQIVKKSKSKKKDLSSRGAKRRGDLCSNNFFFSRIDFYKEKFESDGISAGFAFDLESFYFKNKVIIRETINVDTMAKLFALLELKKQVKILGDEIVLTDSLCKVYSYLKNLRKEKIKTNGLFLDIKDIIIRQEPNKNIIYYSDLQDVESYIKIKDNNEYYSDLITKAA